MAERIDSILAAGGRTLRDFGNVSLPIKWGDDSAFETLEIGAYLTDTGLVADANGHKYVREGSVLIKTANRNEYRLLMSSDVNATTGAIPAGAILVVNKHNWDLRYGGGLVGVYLKGGFFAGRMPSVTNNAVRGLEPARQADLRNRGFRFAEDY